MKTYLALAIGLTTCNAILATTIGFENRTRGSSANGFYSGGVEVRASEIVEYTFRDSDFKYQSETSGSIEFLEDGEDLDLFMSNGVIVRSWRAFADNETIAPYGRIESEHQRARISVDFHRQIAEFSVDAQSFSYNTELIFDGFDSIGNPFSNSISVGEGPFATRVMAAAPTNGYITSFRFEQWDQGPVDLAIDNLFYDAVPDSGATITLWALGFAGLIAFRRRFLS